MGFGFANAPFGFGDNRDTRSSHIYSSISQSLPHIAVSYRAGLERWPHILVVAF